MDELRFRFLIQARKKGSLLNAHHVNSQTQYSFKTGYMQLMIDNYGQGELQRELFPLLIRLSACIMFLCALAEDPSSSVLTAGAASWSVSPPLSSIGPRLFRAFADGTLASSTVCGTKDCAATSLPPCVTGSTCSTFRLSPTLSPTTDMSEPTWRGGCECVSAVSCKSDGRAGAVAGAGTETTT